MFLVLVLIFFIIDFMLQATLNLLNVGEGKIKNYFSNK